MPPHRSKGSWLPRLAGVGVVVVLTAGGLTIYLSSQHAPARPVPHHRHPTLSSKVVKAQTVGVIDFGPDDDGDAFQNDPDDHPLMLHPTSHGMAFITISQTELHDGTPLWTANQMADGSDIFIWVPTGRCLSAHRGSAAVRLSHCDLSLAQRWRPVHATTALGQAIAAYANALTGKCLTAPPAPPENHSPDPGPATQAACGPVRDKAQEIAFWWDAS